MQSFLDFLKQHKLAWTLPIVIFAALLGLLAWKWAHTPADPFIYR
mgnify:CR=1 FL=1